MYHLFPNFWYKKYPKFSLKNLFKKEAEMKSIQPGGFYISWSLKMKHEAALWIDIKGNTIVDQESWQES